MDFIIGANNNKIRRVFKINNAVKSLVLTLAIASTI